MAGVAGKVERNEWLGYLLAVGGVNYEHRRLIHSTRIDREDVGADVSLVVVNGASRLRCPPHMAVNARGCTVVIIVGHLVGMATLTSHQNSTGGVIAIGIFAFIRGWEEYIFVFTMIFEKANWVMSLFLFFVADDVMGVDYGIVAAVGVFYILPVLGLYVFLQKYLVQITIGGIKG